MPKNMTVSADMFGFAFDSMMTEIATSLENGLAPAVKKGCNEAKKATKAAAAGYGWSGAYTGGFSYKVDKSGAVAEGEMGNEHPGLVHLLEKGHATMNGGRTRAFPHVEDGYEAGAEAFTEALDAEVAKALG